MKLILKWIIDNRSVILVTSFAIPFLFFLGRYLWYNHISVIKILPRAKKINCNSELYRKEACYFYLVNNSSNPIYDINILATHPKAVEVNIYPEGRKPEMQTLGKIAMDSSAFQIHFNSIKNKNVSGVQTVINNLAPKETVKLKVEIDKKDCYKSFKLKLKVTFNSKSPKPVLLNR